VDRLAVVQHVLLGGERAHAMAEQEERPRGIFRPGDAAQSHHVRNEEESAGPEIAESVGGWRGAPMPYAKDVQESRRERRALIAYYEKVLTGRET
jgi:hypothetical protein